MTASYQDLMEEARIEQQIEQLVGGDLRSADANAPTVMRDVSDPDERRTVYSTLTGEPRDVAIFMLAKTMRKRRPDGKPAFTAEPNEALPWKQGDVPCYLNPNHPRYTECVQMGIVSEPCRAEHLASLYSQRMHMQNRHRQEWATIQENDKLLRDEEERADRQAMAAAARQAVTSVGEMHGTDWLDALQTPAMTEAIRTIASDSVRQIVEQNTEGQPVKRGRAASDG